MTLLALSDAALDAIVPSPSQGKPFCRLGAGYGHMRGLWHYTSWRHPGQNRQGFEISNDVVPM